MPLSFTLGFFRFSQLLILSLLVIDPLAVYGFTIISPKPSDVFQPGQRITVQVDIGEVGEIAVVKYFWYDTQEDMLEESTNNKLALIATAHSDPPFGGSIPIPNTAIGKMRLLATGDSEEGRLSEENWAIFDEILLQVEPKAELLEINFQTEKPLRLGSAGLGKVYEQVDGLGKIFALPIVGHFSDGIVRPIRQEITGTTYESSDPSILTIDQDGHVRLVGNGQATITAKNRGQIAKLEVQIKTIDDPNEPPMAKTINDQTVTAGTRVTLNGLNSFDPEGESLEYHWSQVRGSKVPLLDPNSAKASFLAPFVVEDRLFRFKLRVTDNLGADSQPAFVDIRVTP